MLQRPSPLLFTTNQLSGTQQLTGAFYPVRTALCSSTIITICQFCKKKIDSFPYPSIPLYMYIINLLHI
jgi:hypothetical protein